jgi:hypothetical protein
MAKGQQRCNREIKKPKASKQVALAPPVSLAKQVVTTASTPKKKG